MPRARETLISLGTEKVKINVLQGSVGAITTNDVMLASASNAIIIGFNVRADAAARLQAMSDKTIPGFRIEQMLCAAMQSKWDTAITLGGTIPAEQRGIHVLLLMGQHRVKPAAGQESVLQHPHGP